MAWLSMFFPSSFQPTFDFSPLDATGLETIVRFRRHMVNTITLPDCAGAIRWAPLRVVFRRKTTASAIRPDEVASTAKLRRSTSELVGVYPALICLLGSHNRRSRFSCLHPHGISYGTRIVHKNDIPQSSVVWYG